MLIKDLTSFNRQRVRFCPFIPVYFLFLGGRRNASVNHGSERVRKELAVSDPEWPVACVQRRPVQTSTAAHVLHPAEVQLIFIMSVLIIVVVY